MLRSMSMTAAEFFRRLESPAGPLGCWLWPRQPIVLYEGKTYAVSRLAWFLARGVLPPEGAHVTAACGTRQCANPSHLTLENKRNSPEDFWRFVDQSDGQGPNGDCWEWLGNCGRRRDGSLPKSRPQFRYRMEIWVAARFALHFFGGGIPDGLHACHHCDNPLCVRPAHLYAGTPKQNQQDATDRNRRLRGERWHRLVKPHMQRGEGHYLAKVSDAQVLEMRERAAGGESQYALARAYGLSRPTVANIIRGRLRSHLGGPRQAAQRQRILTSEEVAQARTRYAAGETMAAIAVSLSVSRTTIHRVVRGKRHRPVPPPSAAPSR